MDGHPTPYLKHVPVINSHSATHLNFGPVMGSLSAVALNFVSVMGGLLAVPLNYIPMLDGIPAIRLELCPSDGWSPDCLAERFCVPSMFLFPRLLPVGLCFCVFPVPSILAVPLSALPSFRGWAFGDVRERLWGEVLLRLCPLVPALALPGVPLVILCHLQVLSDVCGLVCLVSVYKSEYVSYSLSGHHRQVNHPESLEFPSDFCSWFM